MKTVLKFFRRDIYNAIRYKGGESVLFAIISCAIISVMGVSLGSAVMMAAITGLVGLVLTK